MPATLEIIVGPFAMEADHPRNCELKLLCLPNGRLRSAFDGMKAAIGRDGRPRVPKDQSATFGSCPRMPGQILYVNPPKCAYEIRDPLYGDKESCEEIARWLKEVSAIRSGATFDGIKPQSGSIDVHQMKSLCREMFNIIMSGEAKLVKGTMPTMDEIDSLPGRYLLDPGLLTPTARPRYEDDLQGWIDRLNHSGVGA